MTGFLSAQLWGLLQILQFLELALFAVGGDATILEASSLKALYIENFNGKIQMFAIDTDICPFSVFSMLLRIISNSFIVTTCY